MGLQLVVKIPLVPDIAFAKNIEYNTVSKFWSCELLKFAS